MVEMISSSAPSAPEQDILGVIDQSFRDFRNRIISVIFLSKLFLLFCGLLRGERSTSCSFLTATLTDIEARSKEILFACDANAPTALHHEVLMPDFGDHVLPATAITQTYLVD
jgi:hypothetical protein